VAEAAAREHSPTLGSGPGAPGPDPQSEPSLVRSAFSGVALLWRVRWLRAVQILAVVHVLFAVGPWMVALPVLIVEREQPVSVYAAVLGAFSAGTVLGALLGGRITGRSRGLTALALLGLFGITALAPAVTAATPLLIAAFLAGGLGQQAFDVVKMAGLRREVPPDAHGRAFSADFFFSFASLPVGQVIGALLLRQFSPEAIMLWAGGLVLVTTALTVLPREVRRFSDAPDAPATVAGYPPVASPVAKEDSRAG
jgi:MFS family permease